MCGGGKPSPQPTVDPAAERQKAADEAAKKANAAMASGALRRRGQAGLLSTERNASVLGRAVQGGGQLASDNLMAGVLRAMSGGS